MGEPSRPITMPGETLSAEDRAALLTADAEDIEALHRELAAADELERPIPWTWEERPVGEHDWQPIAGKQFFGCICRECGCPSGRFERDGTPCTSRMERRRVTPWEPVSEDKEEQPYREGGEVVVDWPEVNRKAAGR